MSISAAMQFDDDFVTGISTVSRASDATVTIPQLSEDSVIRVRLPNTPSNVSDGETVESNSKNEHFERLAAATERDLSGNLSQKRKAMLANYYTTQAAAVNSFREADNLIESSAQPLLPQDPENAAELMPRTSQGVMIAINGSFIMNLVLFAIKIIVLAQSGSLAVLSSTVDSALDLFSGSVIWATNRYMKKKNRYLYPTGKGRFEPVVTVIIAAVMMTAAFQLESTAVQTIVNGDAEVELTVLSLSLLGTTIVIKLGLYLFIRSLREGTDSTAALATDHLNDVASNTITILTAWIGSRYWNNADPVGAMIIGAVIMVNWYREGMSHVLNLAGRSASREMIQRLTWVAMHHDPRVQMVDTVRASHIGSNVWVEVDIVLPPEMLLHEAHDIGEALQNKLELMPDVDRAHVHLDYEIDHGPEDEHKRL